MGNFAGIKSRKNNSKRRGIPAQEKAKRHLEAQVRQALYDGLSYSEKMQRIASRTGNSQREINRLASQVKKVKGA